MNKKSIAVISIAVVFVAGVIAANLFLFSSKPIFQIPEKSEAIVTDASKEAVGTTTSAEIITATTSSAVTPVSKKIPPRIAIDKTEFRYDIISGTTPCGDKIGTVHVTSDDPSQELYWGITGSMPIWLAFSSVEGKTPATIDMTFNCIMSGAEKDINWTFTLVEKTNDGKWVDGYYRSFKITGDIK